MRSLVSNRRQEEVDVNAQTRIEDPPAAAAPARYATDHVISTDGTTIGYRRLGQGPAVVLLHGSMSSSHNHMQLAQVLADAFTVVVPDRRGRGLSGPYRQGSVIEQEVEDLEAVLARTGADNVFGVSSGAIITLKTALSNPAIRKAAIFEPPLSFSREAASAILSRFDGEMTQGKLAAALITAMKAAQMGPAIFNAMPRRLLELLVGVAIRSEDRKSKEGYVPLRAMAPNLHYDFQIVVEMSGKLESFKPVQADVLLLGGSKSPAYLKAALDSLETVLPHVHRCEFHGLDHAASWNADRGGKPKPVAQALARFFTST